MAVPASLLRRTEAFYAWEPRGRGWDLWDHPVALEPPFTPFLYHGAAPSEPIIDDGRKPTLLSALADRVRLFLIGPDPSLPASESEPETLIEVDPSPPAKPLAELVVALPAGQVVVKEAMERLLLGLHVLRRPVSFEVVGLSDGISTRLACRRGDETYLAEQIAGYVRD